jgi:hypothetical protein
MTPLEIEIILHYGTRAYDFREGDFSAPAVRSTIDEFRTSPADLLEPETDSSMGRTYRLTERGRFYFDELCKLPLPEYVLVMPKRDADTGLLDRAGVR